MRRTQQLGQILVDLGYITQEQLVRAVMEQKDTGERLGSILLKHGYITSEQLTEALARQAGMEYVRLNIADVQAEALSELSPAVARRLQVLPLRKEGDKLVVAPLDVNNAESLRELFRIARMPIRLVYADPAVIEAALRLYYPLDMNDVETAAGSLHVREFVSNLIHHAVASGAEAVHLEPWGTGTVAIRYRVGGRLETIRIISSGYARVAIHHMKNLTGLPIQASQVHFSGSLTLEDPGNSISVEVSCLRTSRGERAVLRPLRQTAQDPLTEGLTADAAETVQQMLASHNGLLIVSGEDIPACQAVVQAALKHKLTQAVSAFSLDPMVASHLPEVHCIDGTAVGREAPELLRAILMQDPDVLVAGELENASMAQMLAAAAAGSNVWVAAVVRAADFAGAIERLKHQGLAPATIAAALLGVVQVYTLPRLCAACRVDVGTTPAEWLTDEPREALVYESRGCDNCRHTGCLGTTNVIVPLAADGSVRELLLQEAQPEEIHRALAPRLQSTLRATLWQKVQSGQITLQHARLLYERLYARETMRLSLAA